MSCVICEETKHIVLCENGHEMCEKCLLKRIKVKYQENPNSYDVWNDDTQICFYCRGDVDDKMLSNHYFKMMNLIQCQHFNAIFAQQRGLTKKEASGKMTEVLEDMERLRVRFGFSDDRWGGQEQLAPATS